MAHLGTLRPDSLPLWCRKLCRHQLAKSSLFAVILQLGQAPIEGLRDLLEIASVKLQQLQDVLVFLRQPRPFLDLTFLQRTEVVPALIRKLANARANQWPLLPELLHRIKQASLVLRRPHNLAINDLASDYAWRWRVSAQK